MNEARVTAYIGLGSNLKDPQDQVHKALRELAELPDTQCVSHSSLYRTRPVGPRNQPDFINAVAMLNTGLPAESLLDECQKLEQRHRRVRGGERWGPRTLDLDLLLFDQQRIATARLVVPHPQLAERAFVLVPLAEIAPSEMRIPGLGMLGELLEKVDLDGVRRLS
ncbi:MAG: 2-amino-4-hydroxy-6-hydroxymethyldihydropteridine diphosphokinase [Pseudomonadota bacterium]